MDRNVFQKLKVEINNSLLDRSIEVDLALICLLAHGHLLIEDSPGTGKTSLAKIFSESLGLNLSRIQMTNDLLPSDITGQFIFNPQTSNFEFKEGPLFSEVVLVDELNRASPRTQSSLLQALEENQISLDRNTFQLSDCFFVIATQNPSENIGTAFLPESQLDRFMMCIRMTPLTKESEIEIFKRPFGLLDKSQIKLNFHLQKDDILKHRNRVKDIEIPTSVAKYISAILKASDEKSNCEKLSLRAGISLARAAQASAYIQDRNYVTHDDIKKIAPSVLSHRLSNNEGLLHGQQLCQQIIQEVPIEL